MDDNYDNSNYGIPNLDELIREASSPEALAEDDAFSKRTERQFQREREELGLLNDAPSANIDAAYTKQDSVLDPGLDSGLAGGGGDSKAPGAELPKPTSLETALGGIRMDGTRQEKFIMLGDPAVQERFYQKMAEMGKLAYRGGEVDLLCSAKDAQKYYIEAASEMGRDIKAHTALDLRLQRGSSDEAGILSKIKDTVANKLGMEHRAVVMVGGDPATVDAKMKELGGMLEQLGERGLLTGSPGLPESVTLKEGKLVLPEEGPAKVNASGRLYDLVAMAGQTVGDFRRQEQAQDELRRASRNASDDKRAPGGAEKSGDAAAGSMDGPVNKHAQGIAERLNDAVQNPARLGERNEKNQEAAESLIYAVRGLKDPAEREFGSLPETTRQQALVQLEALAAKADAQDFSKATRTALDKTPKDGGATFREKLQDLVRAEHLRDPDFAQKARGMADEMVRSGFLKPEQAEGLRSTNVRLALDAQAHNPGAALGRLEELYQAGPKSLTSEQASEMMSLMAKIEHNRWHEVTTASPLHSAETLEKFKAIHAMADSGQFGAEVKAQAFEQRGTLEGWGLQLEGTANKDPLINQGDLEKAATQFCLQRPEWHPNVVERMQNNPELQAVAVSPEPVRNEQAERDTQAAVHRLGLTMANPAGALTTDDKTWDTRNIERTAGAVLKLDPEVVARMPADVRADVAAYASWVADKAASGQLPGFATEAGRAQVDQLQQRAAELAPLAEGAVSEAASKGMSKAEKMVDAMGARERGEVSSATPESASRDAGAGSGKAPSETAKDLVHAVYKESEIGEAYAKYLLKEARQITPEAIQALDPDTRAKTAVALDYLAKQVSSGAIGDFNKLSGAVQTYTSQAESRAEGLVDAYKKDPEMLTAMTKASIELAGRTGSLDKTQAAANDAERVDQARSAGRERGER